MRILVVEDDEFVAQILKILLTNHHYAVEIATDGQKGLELAEAFDYDLILLDIMLPKLDGVSLCQQLRSKGHQMPILLLTGRTGSDEKVMGLDTGADDYVVKPFDQEELIARIRALLRRGHLSSQPVLEWGDLRLNPSSREVTYGTHTLSLTPKEYGLLELFLRNTRLTYSLNMILDHLWPYEEAPGEDAVRVHVKTLRQKLRAAGAPVDLIETVYGVGYRLKPLKPLSPLPSDSSPLLSHFPMLKTLLQGAYLPGSNQPRVMLVSTDLHRRSPLKTLLEHWHLQVILSGDVQNLLETLSVCSPDLLLLDVVCFQRSGLDLCQQIRRDPHWHRLPVILLLPQGDAEWVNQGFAAGADDVVSDPVAGPELMARVLVRLERVQLLRQIAELQSSNLSALSTTPLTGVTPGATRGG